MRRDSRSYLLETHYQYGLGSDKPTKPTRSDKSNAYFRPACSSNKSNSHLILDASQPFPFSMKPRILLFYFLPVLAWMALIFYLSGLPQQDLEGSKGILDLVPGREYTVHAALYAVLALLLSRTLLRLRDRPVLVLLAGGAAASLAYGITDEWHQTFVDGRSASLADLLADAIGAIAGAAAYGTARRIALPGRAGASSHDR